MRRRFRPCGFTTSFHLNNPVKRTAEAGARCTVPSYRHGHGATLFDCYLLRTSRITVIKWGVSLLLSNTGKNSKPRLLLRILNRKMKYCLIRGSTWKRRIAFYIIIWHSYTDFPSNLCRCICRYTTNDKQLQPWLAPPAFINLFTHVHLITSIHRGKEPQYGSYMVV